MVPVWWGPHCVPWARGHLWGLKERACSWVSWSSNKSRPSVGGEERRSAGMQVEETYSPGESKAWGSWRQRGLASSIFTNMAASRNLHSRNASSQVYFMMFSVSYKRECGVISFKRKRKFLKLLNFWRKQSFCFVKGVPDISSSNKSHLLESFTL